MANVNDLFLTVDLDSGRAAIYERLSSDKAVLVKEFPSRQEADKAQSTHSLAHRAGRSVNKPMVGTLRSGHGVPPTKFPSASTLVGTVCSETPR